MTSVAINNLWNYLQTLTLTDSNKQWLADKLLESKAMTKKEKQAKYVRESLERAFAEVKEAQRTGQKMQSARDLLADIETW